MGTVTLSGYESGADEIEETDPREESYTIVTDLSDGSTWLDRESAARLTILLSDDGWDVEIRSPRRGEVEGTYRHDAHGLQILGYGIEEPEALREAIVRLYDVAVRS